jgi:hypothetical protein
VDKTGYVRGRKSISDEGFLSSETLPGTREAAFETGETVSEVVRCGFLNCFRCYCAGLDRSRLKRLSLTRELGVGDIIKDDDGEVYK